MHEIFISYSRLNVDRLDEIVAALPPPVRDRLWIDRHDIPVSMAWLDQVKVAIEGADLFVKLRSDEWQASHACQIEQTAAHELHKYEVDVDLRTDDTLTAAQKILSALARLTPDNRTHTEVVARAGMWRRQGRPRGLLLSGPLIDRARRIQRHGLAFGSNELAFIGESARRRSRRRWASTFGVLGAALALCVACSGLVTVSLIPALRQEADDRAAAFSVEEPHPLANVYDLMAAARSGVTAENASLLRRIQMVRALATPVPVSSYTVGNRLSRILDTQDDDAIVVVTTDGQYFSGQRPIDRPPADIVEPTPHISPVDDLVASSIADEGIVRITRADGELYRVLTVPGRAGPVAFSPNGRDLAVGTGDDVAIFDVATGLLLVTLRGSVGEVRDIGWTGTSSVSAIAGENRVSTWRWRHGTRVIDDRGRTFAAVAGPDRDGAVAAVESNGRVTIVAPESRSVLQTRETSAAGVVGADVHDGLILIAGESGLTLYDRQSDSESTLPVTDCVVWDAVFSPSGEHIYVACGPNGLAAIRASDGMRLSHYEHPDIDFTAVAVAADGRVFAGDGSGLLHEYTPDLDVVAQPLVWVPCRLGIRRIAVNAGGDQVIEAGDAATHLTCTYEAIRRGGTWELQLNSLEPGAGVRTTAVAMTAAGTRGAVGFSDGRVFGWVPVEIEVNTSYHEHGGAVRGLAYSADEDHLVAATSDGIVTVFPSCNFCESTIDLAARVDTILARAQDMGLR